MSAISINQNKGRVLFKDPVSFNSIYALIENITTIKDYYRCNHICIEINSPGGELTALQLFNTYIDQWRKEGVIIETKALSTVASAAALMLSMGDLGYRSALPNAKILYHNVRVNGSMTLTAEKAEYMLKDLKKVDEEVFDRFFDHCKPRLKDAFVVDQPFPAKPIECGDQKLDAISASSFKLFETDVKTLLKKLFALDNYIIAEQAVDLKLIDSVSY